MRTFSLGAYAYRIDRGAHASWRTVLAWRRCWMVQMAGVEGLVPTAGACLLYTSDAADERSSVDLGGRRIIQKKKQMTYRRRGQTEDTDINKKDEACV